MNLSDLNILVDVISQNQKEMAAIEQKIADLNQALVEKRDREHKLLIAREVLFEINAIEFTQVSTNQEAGQRSASGHSDSNAFDKTPKVKTKSLIINTLETQGPLTRKDVLDRAQAQGLDVNGGTIGSTLSRMVSEGVLQKDSNNRYSVKNSKNLAVPQPPSYPSVAASEKVFIR